MLFAGSFKPDLVSIEQERGLEKQKAGSHCGTSDLWDRGSDPGFAVQRVTYTAHSFPVQDLPKPLLARSRTAATIFRGFISRLRCWEATGASADSWVTGVLCRVPQGCVGTERRPASNGLDDDRDMETALDLERGKLMSTCSGFQSGPPAGPCASRKSGQTENPDLWRIG